MVLCVWCLFRPVDSIIDSLVLFLVFILFLRSISSIYCCLRLSFSFRYLSGYLSFAKGSILMRPNPLVCMCLGSKHNVCFSSDVAYIYVSCIEAWFVWWLFHPIDSIIDSLLLFLCLQSISCIYFFTLLLSSFIIFISLLVLLLVFVAKGDMLKSTHPLVSMS